MQQACNKCGYESPETDRFCRQCGGQLSTESELSPTITFNQVNMEPNPPVAGVGTGRFPPSVGDTIAGNTERYYSPPQYAPSPAIPERLPSFEPLKSSSFSWIKSFSSFMKGAFKFLLVAALIVATGMAVFFSQEASRERERNWERQNRARERADRENANSQAQYAWDQMEEALLLAQESADKAAEAGATLTTGNEKPIDLDKFAYESAEIEAKVTKPGNEALSLLARQNFDTVQDFYQRKFGKPVLQVVGGHQGNQRRKTLFQASTQPPILIKVEEIDRGQVKITILHSFLWFPRANEAQARM
jgi:hypothetical protein